MGFHKDMAYWTESKWAVISSSANQSQRLEQRLPFALIGAGTHCDLQLPVQDGLKTAYFACCFDDRIEVWPLCAIAFPVWGVIPSEIEVLLGHLRLRFERTGRPGGSNEGANNTNEEGAIENANSFASDVELTMAWNQKSVTKKIARTVTILGSQHPSVWRTHGRGMQACDHAIICTQNRVWLVDLQPAPQPGLPRSAYELLPNQQYYQIGDMRFSLGPATTESQPSLARRRHQLSVSQAAARSQVAVGHDTAEQKSTTAAGMTTTGVESGPAVTTAEQVIATNAPATNTASRAGLDCPETFTSHLTGRLVSINHSRFTRAKLLKIAASSVTFVAVIVFLTWLFR
ncbi:hypothetical protein [Allorhodopirellula solitaria]|uniref:Uncharacterized protein n=1 Tax=Allorhodopirellula solitaria TaxID=2527987 RepID=A0A5C5X1W9_9BACT|nr:hypothetical protein [Allorhodopirellula solitaria]TWT56251.1 hypothetical protein CA85_44330 [Allorhodopirellula solitaria]